MKKLRMLASFFHGSVFSSIFVSIVLTGALFIAIAVSARVDYLYDKYNTINGYGCEGLYYLQRVPSIEEMMLGSTDLSCEKFRKEVSGDKAIAGIYQTYLVQPAMCEGRNVVVVMYEPEMISDLLDGTKEHKLFLKDKNGCLIADSSFEGMKGELELSFYGSTWTTKKFTVIGHVDYPYSVLSMNKSASHVYAEDLFWDEEVILIQKTEENMAFFLTSAKIVDSMNMMIRFSSSASDSDVNRILEVWSRYGTAIPMDKLALESKQQADKTLREYIPLPASIIIVVTITYISIVLMLVMKKKKDFVVMVLCGASVRTCSSIAVLGNSLVALAGFALNTLFIGLAPMLRRNGLLDLEGLKIGGNQFGIVCIYLALTVLVSGISVYVMIGKKRPIELYNEVK